MPLPPFVCCIAMVTLCYFVPMAIIVNIICWHGKPFCPLPSLSLDCWVRISVWIGGNEMAPPPLPIAHCATWSDVPVCPARPVHPARSVGVNWRRLGPCPVTDGRCGVVVRWLAILQSSRAPSVEDDEDGHLIYRHGDVLQDRCSWIQQLCSRYTNRQYHFPWYYINSMGRTDIFTRHSQLECINNNHSFSALCVLWEGGRRVVDGMIIWVQGEKKIGFKLNSFI